MKFSTAIFKTFFLSVCMIANTTLVYAQTASILPPAKTTFFDQNGNPLTSGTVDFYVPNTTTRKTTWQDSAKAVPNTNPVVLDAAGRALILGDGAYRQVLKDRNGNLVWDQVTSSIGSGSSGTTTVGDGLPVGTILPNSGFVAPANYQFAYGQALSRTTYANLFAAITYSTSIGCVGGSATLNVPDTSSLSVGAVLESICVSGSPTIVSKTSSSVTLSSNSTITVATTGRFFPYGNGDALTTFNVPDLRGYVAAGRCNMGGVDCSVLNSTYFSSNVNNNPSGLNAKGGAQSLAILQANFPNVSLPVTDPGHVHNASFRLGTSTAAGTFAYGGSVDNTSTSFTTDSATTHISVGTGGSGTPISLIQPTVTLNYVIKVLPDTNLTSSSGVVSIGGMTGVLTCGANVVCSGNTISVTSAGVTSIQGMSGSITCGAGLSCSGNTISSTTVATVQSRSDATFTNLSSFNGVETLGYSKGGDGGGAKFYKYNTAILTFSITNAGSCNNGTWPGIKLTGGTGKGATGTLIVSGGVATNFSLHGLGSQGNGYTVGDVLTVSNAGGVVCTTYPTITVNSVGNGPFIDSSVTGYTWANVGSGCTNGSYAGVALQNTVINGGGYGYGLILNVDIAGGAVVGTSLGAPGGGYRVGDQLSPVYFNGNTPIPGCVTQPILQITSVATPVGSFTDSSGANFQIINDNNLNVLQFGAKGDFTFQILDADATNNGPAMRAALEFVAVGNGPSDAKGYGGGKLFIPKGGYVVCGGLRQYQYTTLYGAGWGATTLKQCNSDTATSPLLTQGGNTLVGEFGINTWDMTLYGSALGTGPVIYSNNAQSGDAVSRVVVYPNSTSGTCIKYEIGYGGQSMYGVHNFGCVPVNGSPAMDFSGNFGVVIDGETMVASAGTVAVGMRFGDGGVVSVGAGVHCEGSVTNCVSVNGAGTSPPQVTLTGLLGPATTNLIRVETGTPAGYVSTINARANGSPCTVFNQATATCVKTGNQTGLNTYP